MTGRQRATDTHRAHGRQRLYAHRSLTHASLLHLGFEYESDIDYVSLAQIIIGAMDKQSQHYHAFKYKGDFCCAPGNCAINDLVVLPSLNSTQTQGKTLFFGATPQSKLFLRKIRKLHL
ncbi:hypothetical protein CEXT_71581 [Caerostris extrusa]|uniref:Uncharacterized protein n=1 Tax=Caerostris extrusa TaxID=172846 RepID=A0AAV4V2K8_CAEEX|nr:hypothetical protein CEXT_71581 [Caerostris extrusa]